MLPVANLKILVVEDDDSVRRLLAEHLAQQMPVDVEAHENGNIILEHGDNPSAPPLARYIAAQQLSLDVGGARYVSHFASCPEAASWRR